jgi:NAD(P)-dependent dehydrogenase (short-subunit alcohol dehydrogenase family)
MENAEAVALTMTNAGFDVIPIEMDLSSRDSILNMIAEAQKQGEIAMLIKRGGADVTISSQSGHRMPALGAEIDDQQATTPTEELLTLEVLRPENIQSTLHAYQLAKRCNVKRVMAEAVKWGERSARINSISPGIVVTPLAIDEFNGPVAIFTRTCSPIPRLVAPERQMRLPMWPSCS